jgi:hypothetical protein
MKKTFVILLSVMMLTCITAFADGIEVKVIHDLGDYKIVAEAYPHAAPRGGPTYIYRNYGVVDSDGNTVVELKYGEILPPTEGRAAFVLDGKIGFFDENWNVCIENKYFSNRYPLNTTIYFSEGLAAVGKSDAARYIVWGYIDRNGNEITDFIYDSAEPFKDGFARVGIDEHVYSGNKTKYGKIDREGNVVEPFKFGYALGMDYEYLWQEPVDVLLSENLVELNGKRYMNSELEHPFINYLGFSYIPLTYYGCRMLGINCDWTAESGVMLTSGGTPSEDITGYNGMKEGVYDKATFYKGRISINGTVYEYGDTAYPLIHYKNIVYIPVNWRQGLEQLGIKYSFVGAEKIENSDRGCMVFNTK